MTPVQRENIARGKEPTMPIGLTETETMRKIRVRREIVRAFVVDGCDSETAECVLDAIEDGRIPHLAIDWNDEEPF